MEMLQKQDESVLPPPLPSVPLMSSDDKPPTLLPLPMQPTMKPEEKFDMKPAIQKFKKRRSRWKESQFPKEFSGRQYCADCKKMSRTLLCEEKKCRRRCWRWCEKCSKYRDIYHKCDLDAKRKKRKKPWNKKDFPVENSGAFFCLDCKKNAKKRECDCGRDCWVWCDECGGYRSKYHRTVNTHLEEPERKKQKTDQNNQQYVFSDFPKALELPDTNSLEVKNQPLVFGNGMEPGPTMESILSMDGRTDD